MTCGCTENKNLNKDKLSLESMQSLSIDEIISLYRQGYTLEESENFTNIRSLALSSPQFQYATAVQGVPSANKIRITWIWSNTGAYGYGQFKFYDAGTSTLIGTMPSSCYDPGPSQLYRLSTYDITYTTAPADISVRAYRCSSDTEQSCPAGTCSAPTESDREYAELLLSEFMTTPSQPSTLNITPGNGSLTLSWSAVTNTPILGYHIVIKRGGTTVIDGYWSQNVGPITITGLTNEISHDVLVSAISASNVEGTAKTGSGTPSLPAPTCTAITDVLAIPNPVIQGQTTTLTATTTPAIAGFSVAFKDSATTLSTQTTNSSGVATYPWSTTGQSTGAHSITATVVGQCTSLTATTVIVTTVAQVLTSISPASATVQINTTQQFTAKDQNTNTITTGVTWAKTAGVGSINGTTGLYSAGPTDGAATISATYGGVTKTAQITVTTTPPPQAGGGGAMMIAAVAAIAIAYFIMKKPPTGMK